MNRFAFLSGIRVFRQPVIPPGQSAAWERTEGWAWRCLCFLLRSLPKRVALCSTLPHPCPPVLLQPQPCWASQQPAVLHLQSHPYVPGAALWAQGRCSEDQACPEGVSLSNDLAEHCWPANLLHPSACSSCWLPARAPGLGAPGSVTRGRIPMETPHEGEARGSLIDSAPERQA